MLILPDFLNIGTVPFSCENEGDHSLEFFSVTIVRLSFIAWNSETPLPYNFIAFSICSTLNTGSEMAKSFERSKPESSKT